MLLFTVDFAALMIDQKLSYAELADKADLTRHQVRRIVIGEASTYNRLQLAQLLTVLDVTPYKPCLIESTNNGQIFTLDFMGLMETTGLGMPDLAADTGYRYRRVYGLVTGYDTHQNYDREFVGALLNALDAKLYHPFKLLKAEEENHNVKRLQDYLAARGKRRRRKRKPPDE